jgi:tetratricopeptide (TPR) repeat protein
MSDRRTPSDDLPEAVRTLLDAARDAYRDAEYSAAEEKNRQALRAAEEYDHAFGKILGQRYVGLCLYRRGQLEGSEAALRAGLALAREHGHVAQALFLSNHLGATLRRSGRVEDALSMFEDALREAERTGHREARAHLLGSLGALYAELGQLEAATDCYARCEDAFESLQVPHRLANARGLVGGAAKRRGDNATARRKFDDELRLGKQLNSPTRIVSALLHQAKLAATPSEDRRDDALRLFAEAADKARAIGETQRLVEVLVPYAEFMRQVVQLREAHTLLQEAEGVELGGDQPELSARIRDARARLCRDAGLHGEALFHQSQAMQHRITIYRPLARPEVRRMAQARIEELSGFLNELLDEAGRVVRDAVEQEELIDLVEQVDELRGKRIDRSSPTADRWRRRFDKPGAPLWHWLDEIREEAQRQWSERLLPTSFGRLDAATQSDLLRSTLVYHAAVDDLGRSAHLLALSIEREMRLRLLAPMRQLFRARPRAGGRERSVAHRIAGEDHVGLSRMLELAEELAAPIAGARRPDDFLHELQPRVAGCTAELAAIARLRLPVTALDGTEVGFVKVRNAVAHGTDRAAGPGPSRLQVDAIRRMLVLEQPGILEGCRSSRASHTAVITQT